MTLMEISHYFPFETIKLSLALTKLHHPTPQKIKIKIPRQVHNPELLTIKWPDMEKCEFIVYYFHVHIPAL